jgi:hypothetical protein
MRHHAKDIAFVVQNSGDVTLGSVGVVEVAKRDSIFAAKGIQRSFVSDIAALAVSDGHSKNFSFLIGTREGRMRGRNLEAYWLADEFQSAVAHESAGEKSAFDQDLESVANADHWTATGREPFHRRHYGREFGNRAAAKIVAIRETAGKDNGVAIAYGLIAMPKELGRVAEVVSDCVPSIVVAVAAREDDDPEFHAVETLV